MRLLHVVPTYLPATRYGGPIYSVHGLCAALARLGHEVHVFTTSVDGPQDSAVPHGRPVDVEGVLTWYFRSRIARRLYWSPVMARTLRREVGRFDLVHLHSVFLWPTAMAARAAEAAAVPYVVSPRGMLVPELIARKNSWVKRAWLATIESRTLKSAAAVHLTSQRELTDARRLALPLPAPFVIANGVVPPLAGYRQRASARVRAICAGPAYALYLGRVHWKKGLDRALRSLAGTPIRLIVCGNDEEGYRAQLERLVAQTRARDQVSFEGPVSGDDKWTLLAGSRFVVLPSLNENFGNVVTEAMAVGRPVVVTEGVGAGDLVRDAGAGLVCAPEDQALRAAMLRLWNDPAEADAMGEAGRAFSGARLHWDHCAKQMAEHYAMLARAKPRRG